jgi:hypothetical protein
MRASEMGFYEGCPTQKKMLKKTLQFVCISIPGAAIITGAVVSVVIALSELVVWLANRVLIWLFIIPILGTIILFARTYFRVDKGSEGAL